MGTIDQAAGAAGYVDRRAGRLFGSVTGDEQIAGPRDPQRAADRVRLEVGGKSADRHMPLRRVEPVPPCDRVVVVKQPLVGGQVVGERGERAVLVRNSEMARDCDGCCDRLAATAIRVQHQGAPTAESS